MNRKRAGLYYNPEFGYIITSYAYKKNTVFSYVIDPVITISNQTDVEFLGDKIAEALHNSQNAPPLEPSEAKGVSFWKCTGVKNFNSFCKDFRNIKIDEAGGLLEIVEWKRDKSGGYVGHVDDVRTHLSLDSTPEQIGVAVMQMLSGEVSVATDINREFSTLDGSKVTYARPSDAFLDIDDGHTDAYQVFVHEDNDKTSIAFLIDNPYSEVSENAIKEKWQRWYGELIEFQYQEISDVSLKVKVSGKTETSILVSYFYQDGDMLMEVMTKVDRVGTSEEIQHEIEKEFRKVVETIKITR
ncbi:MAG: hypothetical protein FWD05_14575 [Oscillospiraceae bacterium]|nr:hypothetical protein [Oscillospiraceae bacterium]